MAAKSDIPFLGEIPLARRIRETSDEGVPIVVAAPDGEHAKAFAALASRVEEEIEKRGQAALPMIH